MKIFLTTIILAILLFTSNAFACFEEEQECHQDNYLNCSCHELQCKMVKECTTECSKECSWDLQYKCGCWGDKVEVCKVPPGNPANAHSICVSENSVDAHLKTGSYLGECEFCYSDCEKENCTYVKFCWCDHCDDDCDDDCDDCNTDDDTGNDTGDTGPVDTGEGDSGNPDTGVGDSGVDIGTVDTGNKDTGTVDTDNKDTGIVDTGNKDTGNEDTETIFIDTGMDNTGEVDTNTCSCENNTDDNVNTEDGLNPDNVKTDDVNNESTETNKDNFNKQPDNKDKEIIFAGGGCSMVFHNYNSIFNILF